jgi:deoxyadenosine/deoxycytidine kinase
MDLNVGNAALGTTAYRTRIQRRSAEMENHTKNILNFARELFVAYKEQFEKYAIGGKPKKEPK